MASSARLKTTIPFDSKTNEALSWLKQFSPGDYCNTPKVLVLGSRVLSNAYSRHLAALFSHLLRIIYPLVVDYQPSVDGKKQEPQFQSWHSHLSPVSQAMPETSFQA